MALGIAMQKIESAVIAVVLGIAFPFIVTYLVSGGASSSFLIPCTSAASGSARSEPCLAMSSPFREYS